MPKWRSEYRRCDNCRSEYRAKREAQSYCSRDCRRAAAYGRERFKAGTVGRLLPGIQHRIEPIDGIAEGGRLYVRGPNVMLGYLRADRINELNSRSLYSSGRILLNGISAQCGSIGCLPRVVN